MFEAYQKKGKLAVRYQEIISLENLLLAWTEFKRGKTKKQDVQKFELHLMDHLIDLHESLKAKTYVHGPYHAFKINDPKPRDIHKASVRDRVLHHALYRSLAPYFFARFIHDSYSCQDGKGVHRALKRFEIFSRRVSKNNTKQCFILKCDIRKFFASIDQDILMKTLEKYIVDQSVPNLLKVIITSLPTGLPLGNLTSQLLVNVYMHEFDQFVKHVLKVKYYIRYADDFVIFSSDKQELVMFLTKIHFFLRLNLNLELHPDKVSIETLGSGVDFLGWVHFPDHRVLRTVTKRRMLRRVALRQGKFETLESYRGMLSRGNGWRLSKKLLPILGC